MGGETSAKSKGNRGNHEKSDRGHKKRPLTKKKGRGRGLSGFTGEKDFYETQKRVRWGASEEKTSGAGSGHRQKK